jgi:cell division protein FtsW (lipid II flippase)
MTPSLHRTLASLACRLLQALLPRRWESWGWAIRYEVEDTPNDTEALLFALSSLGGLLPRILAFHLHRLLGPPHTLALSPGASTAMITSPSFRPRALGIACATGAVLLGLAYMAVAGAPPHYLAINAAALVAGALLLLPLASLRGDTRDVTGAVSLAMAGVLLATALFGAPAEGASRWITIASVSIQPSLVLLPFMILAFARARTMLTALALLIAAAALAFQPDRAMAGTLVVSLAVLALIRADRQALILLGAGILGFAVTLAGPDRLPAAPYVDQIFYTAFDVHPAAGAAVLAGALLLLVPAILCAIRDRAHRATYAALGATWLAVILAAAIGNYPTPVVGYGGSAILGYLLSLAMLPKVAEDARVGENSRTGEATNTGGYSLRAELT